MARKKIESSPLIGKFLVSLPKINDPRFNHCVVLLCGHDQHGAMGIIVNKHLESLSLAELLLQLDIIPTKIKSTIKVHYGGPVELGRGFIIHTEDYMHKTSLKIADDIVLTSNIEVLHKIGNGTGPARYMLALGYTGWSAGQLEDEIKNDGWIQVDVDLDILYSNDVSKKWQQTMAKIGVDPDMLFYEGGHA